jgi:hypothetical protein
MSIVLKELRETFSCLKIIERAKLYGSADDKINIALKENNELVSIFVKSIETSKSKVK